MVEKKTSASQITNKDNAVCGITTGKVTTDDIAGSLKKFRRQTAKFLFEKQNESTNFQTKAAWDELWVTCGPYVGLQKFLKNLGKFEPKSDEGDIKEIWETCNQAAKDIKAILLKDGRELTKFTVSLEQEDKNCKIVWDLEFSDELIHFRVAELSAKAEVKKEADTDTASTSTKASK